MKDVVGGLWAVLLMLAVVGCAGEEGWELQAGALQGGGRADGDGGSGLDAGDGGIFPDGNPVDGGFQPDDDWYMPGDDWYMPGDDWYMPGDEGFVPEGDGPPDTGCPYECCSDEDCSAGQVCQDGLCMPVQCLVDTDCPVDSVCDSGSGTCQAEGQPCEDACSYSGQSQCQQNAVEQCQRIGGCLVWVPQEDCGDHICQSGVCLACGEAQQPCCANDTCASGLVCQAGSCSEPDGECTDECSVFAAARECVDTDEDNIDDAYRECIFDDDDDCLEWSEPIPCAEGNTCQDGQCPDGRMRECVDVNHFRECQEQDGTLCVVWGNAFSCEVGSTCQGAGECRSCGQQEICGDLLDNNCNAKVDEDCDAKSAAGCGCSGADHSGAGLWLLLALFARRRLRRR